MNAASQVKAAMFAVVLIALILLALGCDSSAKQEAAIPSDRRDLAAQTAERAEHDEMESEGVSDSHRAGNLVAANGDNSDEPPPRVVGTHDQAVAAVRSFGCRVNPIHGLQSGWTVSTSVPGIVSPPASAAYVPYLAGIDNLTVLRLGSEITDEELKTIGQLTDLQQLVLRSPKVTEAGFTHLSKLPKLESFSVIGGDIQVNKNCLEHLAKIEELRGLSIIDIPLEENALVSLSEMTHLTSLSLRGTSIGDFTMRQIIHLDQLEELDIAKTEVTNAGAAAIAQIDGLRRLYIQHTRMTEDGLRQLRPLDNLILLHLSKDQFSQADVQRIGSLIPSVKAVVFFD